MSIAVEKLVVTPEQLLAMPDAIGYELVDGELRNRHMGSVSSYIGGTVYFLLRTHVTTHQSGWVFPSDNGFLCFPNAPKTLRRPDVSFIRAERLKVDQIPEGWLTIVPDLVVEVVSPNDLLYEVEEKVEEYIKAGVPLIWIVIPPSRSVRVVNSDKSSVLLREHEELSGQDVLGGFVCKVADLFLPAFFDEDPFKDR